MGRALAEPHDGLRDAATAFAVEIAGSAPFAIESIRGTLRSNLADRIAAASDHEAGKQARLGATADFTEGVNAMAERREPRFTRR
jgi:2-(1,2-epoxy-1,2-dihydrophenyl)acetyl-CoA isomerase